MTPEGKVSKEIEDYLNKQRILNGRRQATTVKNGEADRWLLYKGIYVHIEIKRPGGGITTLLQKNKLKALRENGGVGLVVDCVEDVMKVLDDIDILVWNELNNLKYDRLKEINTLFNDSR